MNPEHGTNPRYAQHLRDADEPCPACRAASTLYQNRLRARRNRLGAQLVDSTPYSMALKAVAPLVNLNEIGRLAGVAECTVHAIKHGQRRIRRETAAQLDRVLRELADKHIAAWTECVDHLDYATPRKHDRVLPRRWPVGPVLEWAALYDVSLKKALNPADYRQTLRVGLLNDGEADRIAIALDVMPHELWPDWFNLEEAS